jgi:hypothetical protein
METDEERTCPIWPETAALLQKLIEQRDPTPGPSAALFLNAGVGG